MVAFYVDRINRKIMELEEVPKLWKEKVRAELSKEKV